MYTVVDNLIQCFGCGIFDRLFIVISAASVAVYEHMVDWALLALLIFWVFYILWVFWSFLFPPGGKEQKDFSYIEKLRMTFVNTLLVMALLFLGITVPRFISIITFEPAANITTVYTQAILQIDSEMVEERITYRPLPMDDDGIFRPELRDSVILLMATVTTQFQGMITLGIAVMDGAFSWAAIRSPAALLRHILMFLMGAYLVYFFFRAFIRFCCYFLDVILELAMFAFFFPFMLVSFVLQNSESQDWVKAIGKGFSGERIKGVVQAIVNLAASVIVFVIIMVIIARFFQAAGTDPNTLANLVLEGNIRGRDLSTENLLNLTLMSMIILGYLINYITGTIKDVGNEIFSVFNVKPEGKEGEKVAKAIDFAAASLAAWTVKTGKIAMGIEEKKEEEEKT